MSDYSRLEVMNEATLAAASTVPTTMAGTECAVIDLGNCGDFALTIETTFGENNTGNVVAHLRSSPYGGAAVEEDWDTEDYAEITLTCVQGSRVQVTKPIDADPGHMKVQIVNEDPSYGVVDTIVTKVTSFI